MEEDCADDLCWETHEKDSQWDLDETERVMAQDIPMWRTARGVRKQAQPRKQHTLAPPPLLASVWCRRLYDEPQHARLRRTNL